MFANHANNKTKTPAEGKSKRTDSAPGGKDAALLNPVWQSLARRLGSIQPKLTVSQPDDPYERDADQIADRVMRMPNNGSRADGNSASPPISPPARHQHNSPESNQEPAPTLQSSLETGAGQALPRDVQKHRHGNAPRDEARAANDSSQANPVWQSLALRSDVLQPKDAVRQPGAPEGSQSIGQPLEPSTLNFMESRLGQHFGGVRVHTGPDAVSSARSLRARAFTIGNNIVFASGEYTPETAQGKALIAHELAHVVQQRDQAINPTVSEPPDSRAEHEAHHAGLAAMRGQPPPTPTTAPQGIPRDVGWAQRGSFPDPYGMGYNTILTNAGASARAALYDLASLEQMDLSPNTTTFSALPATRALDVLNLQPHAVGTACENWFPLLRAQLQTQGLSIADPYGGPTTVSANYFPGRSERKALIIGGVHNLTEPQGAAVVDRLRILLTSRIGANHPPYFTTILVPNLFAASRYSSSQGSGRWIQGGTGTTQTGTLQSSRYVEPNRNFPLPGEGLDAARARGASSATAPELVFQPSATGAPRPAQDTSGAGHQGTSTRMLSETRTLISLIEHFRPERIASVHAHSLKSIPGDAPGIFVDPRGVDPTTGAVTNAAQALQDDQLATAMVSTGRSRLTSSPITGAPTDPFVGNAAGTARSRVRYASGAHAEGNSLGMWAPAPVASGSGARAGITTVTIEVPQWRQSSQTTQLSQIEDLDRDLLADIFLEDPAVVTPPTGPATP